MITRALLSVSDKEGIAEFGKRLATKGIEIIATGGTAATLKGAGVRVREVGEVTGFPECFGGRIKTVHPKILGGILMDRKRDAADATKLGIGPIDLVVVNLYPFEQDQTIEQIDVGGVTLLRAAAKNCEWVTVICDPSDYELVLEQIEKNGDTTPALRRALAAKAFLRTAMYDAVITEFFSGGKNHGLFMTGERELRYGENPHQWGKLYQAMQNGERRIQNPGVAGARVSQGKEMSYLNYLDADEAWQCVQEFDDPTVVFLKHASPCGVASNGDILQAFRRGYDSDPRSAFGVIIALNRECSQNVVSEIIDRTIFTELLLAPGFTKEALTLLKEKPSIRVLVVRDGTSVEPEYRSISGGVLVQSPDRRSLRKEDLKVVTRKRPTSSQIADLLFAAKVVKHVKSNAVVFAKDQVTVGIGPGQTSRVDATEIASRKAGVKAKGAVMASDAFFPFPDSVEEAARHGIAAIVQPGGSIRDIEVIAKADELGIAMVTTGIRAFRH